MEALFQSKFSDQYQALLVPVFSDEDFSKSVPKELASFVSNRQKHQDFLGKDGEVLMIYPDIVGFPNKVLLFGLDEKKKFSREQMRIAAACAIKELKKLQVTDVGLYVVPAFKAYSQELGEGLVMGNFNPAKYKTGKEAEDLNKCFIKKIYFASYNKTALDEKSVRRGMQIASAVNDVRDWVNGPPNIISTEFLAKKGQELGKKYGYKTTVLTRKHMTKLGMNALLAVNRGSQQEARLVVLEYTPKMKVKKDPVVLVGKGIVYDSGGYNLKNGAWLDWMQLDMAGVGTILGLFSLLKPLEVKQPVIAVLPITDNLIDSNSYKPSEIITTYGGKTVEITNTDAEGRLILADAISYAIKHFKFSYLIDLATLTGAAIMALGERYAALFGNDKQLMNKIQKAGEAVDELVWQMPIHPDDREKIKSKVADIVNSDKEPRAEVSKSAAFLQEFVGDAHWAHIDIAGTSFVRTPKKYEYPMGTGYGVRLLLEFLEKQI